MSAPEQRLSTKYRGGLLRGLRDGASPFGAGAIMFWGIVGLASGLVVSGWMHWQNTPTTLVAVISGVLGLCLGLYAAMGTSRLARILGAPGFLMELPF
jgi:hypothetical protein